ncbi:glycosyltransferase family 2 protein [Carboxylicivirga sediminis]|uniref:Glycosyltransferase family 2 protein n=1 Tax=Carboxylicivirga sediminis TaxID=2006564 RepID=A0A941F3Z4_9BACT|nr:glycosyltransferase family 2 protein [Carboxylicivirga sediminis]MBR8535967.1 glycosyltransferase family 2 protein [Carboxylicivirga sediminis]
MNDSNIELSIIIVGYNAIDFLKLTLDAVSKAICNINAEVLLIDNSNSQLLQATIRKQYPFVEILPNSENLGFAKANNLGLRAARGHLAILLNPDTIVAEDSFSQVLKYYKNNPNTGGLGVKMIDGNGHYLKESKRGFPDVKTSFFKLAGLHKLFPQSKLFANYYVGHLNQNDIHSVDVLSGAFLTIPRDNKSKFTQLDESYFMYGEDIDLSWRLKQAHGSNIYFPNTTIIHFKGQSTILNRTIIGHFYNAMWLFYKQHIYSNKWWLTNSLIWSGIKLATNLHIASNLLTHCNHQRSKHSYFQKSILLSDNKGLQQSINNALGTIVKISISGISKSADNQLTIFDFAHTSYKAAIEMIEKQPGNYAFLTYDQKSLIICTQSDGKGQVIHL